MPDPLDSFEFNEDDDGEPLTDEDDDVEDDGVVDQDDGDMLPDPHDDPLSLDLPPY